MLHISGGPASKGRTRFLSRAASRAATYGPAGRHFCITDIAETVGLNRPVGNTIIPLLITQRVRVLKFLAKRMSRLPLITPRAHGPWWPLEPLFGPQSETGIFHIHFHFVARFDITPIPCFSIMFTSQQGAAILVICLCWVICSWQSRNIFCR